MVGRVIYGTLEGMIHDGTTICGGAAFSCLEGSSGQLSMRFVELSIPRESSLWN
jgi:hypothetical protein